MPALFWLEVGNVLVRRAELADEQVLEGLIHLEELAFLTIEIDRPLRWRAVESARRFGLTTYDALYLALADASGAQLATLDRRLGAAASAMGCRYGEDGRPSIGETAAA